MLTDSGSYLTLSTVNINNATRTEVCTTDSVDPLAGFPDAFDGYGDTLYVYYAGTYDTIYTLSTSDCSITAQATVDGTVSLDDFAFGAGTLSSNCLESQVE